MVNIFDDLLLDVGYFYNKEYDNYSFKFIRMDRYLVNSEFPCLRQNNLLNSIINVKYDLILKEIEEFRKDL